MRKIAPLKPRPFAPHDVRLISQETAYRGHGRIERAVVDLLRYDSTESGPVRREAYFTPDAVTVLPYDSALDAVILVEQFRLPVFLRDEPAWIFEAIAGLIDPGETPETTAVREAREEAGVEVHDLHRVTAAYSSPGVFGEVSHVFVGRADLSGAGGHHGLAEEHEDIRAVVALREDALEAIRDGRIRDAITIIALQWLALNHDLFR